MSVSARRAAADRARNTACGQQADQGEPPTHRLLTTIPLSDLVPGQYVLTVEAWSHAILALPASREIPFSVH